MAEDSENTSNNSDFQRTLGSNQNVPSNNKTKFSLEENGRLRLPETQIPLGPGGRHLSVPFDTATMNGDLAKKQNGSAVRTNSLGSGARTPPLERKSRLAALGRLFKPWKWKRKKKSDKFEAASRTLERKISVRANRDELVQKGILLPESPISTIPEPGEDLSPTYGASSPAPAPTAAQALQQQLQAHLQAHQQARLQAAQNNNIIEPKKDKVDGAGGAACEAPRPERPSTLAPGRLPRRIQYQTDTTEAGGGECERLVLSQLPEPPIALSEIGPIPPPPMFSSPSPVQRHATLHAQDLSDSDVDEDELDDQEGSCAGSPLPPQPDPCIDTSRVEEIPPKEPKFNAVPLKSALKKRTLQGVPSGGSGPATPTQEGRPLGVRQDHLHASFNSRPVRIANTAENKENTRPWEGDYRDDYQNDNDSIAAKLARKESLNIKLALRPDRQELINRNILVLQSDHERQESWEAIGARLVRRLSMRPTAEELVERNILKSQSPAEEKKQKEEKKRYLLRKLSFRPTVDELREKKIIRFSDYIEVTCAHDYDRRADKPWTRLTPRDKAAIRRELNEFKSSEMAVHEDSRHLTRFHRP